MLLSFSLLMIYESGLVFCPFCFSLSNSKGAEVLRVSFLNSALNKFFI